MSALTVLDHQITRLIRHLLDLQRDRVRWRIDDAQIADVVIIVVLVIVVLVVSFEDRSWNDDG